MQLSGKCGTNSEAVPRTSQEEFVVIVQDTFCTPGLIIESNKGSQPSQIEAFPHLFLLNSVLFEWAIVHTMAKWTACTEALGFISLQTILLSVALEKGSW